MFVTPALAQSTGAPAAGAGGMSDLLIQFAPIHMSNKLTNGPAYLWTAPNDRLFFIYQ